MEPPLEPQVADQREYSFNVGSASTISVSDNEQLTTRLDALAINASGQEEPDEDEEEDGSISEEDEEDLEERAEETRLRYERMNTRGRIQEIAYNNQMQRQKELVDDAASNGYSSSNRRDRSRSHSKSRSRPSTPMLGALFKRDNFAMALTTSQSPPVQPVSAPDKS